MAYQTGERLKPVEARIILAKGLAGANPNRLLFPEKLVLVFGRLRTDFITSCCEQAMFEACREDSTVGIMSSLYSLAYSLVRLL